MNEELTLSEAGGELIKAFESCGEAAGNGNFRPYTCPGGVLTIGWGHTNANGRKFAPAAIWTQTECDAAFREDMRHFEGVIRNRVTVPLNQNQFDALISFTYNCGEGNLVKSTLLRLLNQGDFEATALEFPKWNLSRGIVLQGLVRRRASEALMFRGIPDHDHDGIADQMPHQVEGPQAAIA